MNKVFCMGFIWMFGICSEMIAEFKTGFDDKSIFFKIAIDDESLLDIGLIFLLEYKLINSCFSLSIVLQQVRFVGLFRMFFQKILFYIASLQVIH